MSNVLIKYESASTVGDRHVGSVYVVDIEHPTRFTEDRARELIQRHRWPSARTVFAHTAKGLS